MNYPNAPGKSPKTCCAYAAMLFATVLVLLSGSDVKANTMRTSLATGESTWFVNMQRFAQSAHSAFTCDECHGSMLESGRQHPDETRPDFLKRSATQAYDYRRCRKCHELAFKRYQTGGHAKARQEEKTKPKLNPDRAAELRTAPTCGDCHNSHYVRSGRTRIDVGRAMVGVCGRCHPAHTSSYLDNIHGKLGVHLANAEAAFCSDCHGAHTVDALKKQENALTVCRRCHHQAGEKFTGIVVHASLDLVSAAQTETKKSLVWIQRIRWMAIAMVALSLAFFIGHSFLWLLREIHEKLRKH